MANKQKLSITNNNIKIISDMVLSLYVDEDNQGEFDEETTLKYALNYCIDVIEDKETILDVNFLGEE
jgi:CRISPR/Cas system-associated endonuclease Cas3-HD|tara:strand:+ start:723 stop:923 length:201 start_codon:yes stop_codon:yes gene_type:complete